MPRIRVEENNVGGKGGRPTDIEIVEDALERALRRSGASAEELQDDGIWAAQVFDSAYTHLPERLQIRLSNDVGFAEEARAIEQKMRTRMGFDT